MTAKQKDASTDKVAPDWERIEADYRAGVLSIREIAGEHGITEGAIRKRAKRDGWSRDLAEKVRSKSEDLVRKDLVRSAVRTESGISEREIVDANAEAIAGVRIAHRKDIARSRALAISLLSELEEVTGNRELFEQLGELISAPDEKGVDKLNELYRKVTSLSGRVVNMKALSETLKTLVTLEREAYGISDAQKPELPGENTGKRLGDDPIEAAMAYQKFMQG